MICGGGQWLWDVQVEMLSTGSWAQNSGDERKGQNWRDGSEVEFKLMRLDKIAWWGLHIGEGTQDLSESEYSALFSLEAQRSGIYSK